MKDLSVAADLSMPSSTACDGSGCSGVVDASGTSGCKVDGDCTAAGLTHCKVSSMTCVACLGDQDCGANTGLICDPSTNTCLSGCSATQTCPNPNVCNLDAGLCVECTADTDCTGVNAHCDLSQHKCASCGPTGCPKGQYCSVNGCINGCNGDTDCNTAAPPDGGYPPGSMRCSNATHTCVDCVVDADCAPGNVCTNNQCVSGCSAVQGCPNALTCCGPSPNKCVDATTDVMNCGACGTACNGGWQCCGASCSNPTNDAMNCGGCGIICAVANGTPKCVARVCAIASCNPGFQDCNGNSMDGCETHIDSNPNNCGGCNNVCTLSHAQAKCLASACQVDTCLFPYGDCDGLVANGCEVNLQTSVTDCGACNSPCSPANASGLCSQGVCKISACQQGYQDCNNDPSDGCETYLANDVLNCGTCKNACAPAHGNGACVAGQCQVAGCTPGFADCNLLPGDGCEIDTTSDVNHCGTCAMACPSIGGSPACVESICGIACATGFADCDKNPANGCEVNILTSAANCNGCGDACSGTNINSPTCSAGSCNGTCNTGYADCNANKQADGCEINTAGDADNCGSCGTMCSTNHVPTPSCGNGTCNGNCEAGYSDCNGNKLTDGCEINTDSDVKNCGTCGSLCPTVNIANPTCVSGACNGTCATGWADCNHDKSIDGCEINVGIDARNCGACNAVCSPVNMVSVTCGGGQCNGTCATGFGDCNSNKLLDGCESNIYIDSKNCGSCGSPCSANNIASPICSGGFCLGSCNPGFKDCNANKQSDGCEANVNTDPNNCGDCGHTCVGTNMATVTCTNGQCSGTCLPGYGDCDGNLALNGCESKLSNDVANCGGCGMPCSANNMATVVCTAGACTGMCDSGYADCDNNKQSNGCEVSLFTDKGNCGKCGTSCSNNNITNPTCMSGVCNGNCDNGYADCNNNKLTDGCEVNVLTSAANCGMCGVSCPNNNIANPTCGNGMCNGACNTGFADCNNNKLSDGCEANVGSDPTNCGGCGSAYRCSSNNIASPTCFAGVCNGACNNGYADCNGSKLSDGCEMNTATSSSNCGGCNVTCSGNNIVNATCSSGICNGTCTPGFGDCNGDKQTDGCEVPLQTSATNCGGCGVMCSKQHIATPSCAAGACNGACNPGYADCNGDKLTDGCETVVGANDVNNCGGCNAVCSTTNMASTACTSGVCSGMCNPGYADCDGNKLLNGCEVNTNTDKNNCGGCTPPSTTAFACSSQNMANVSCDSGVCDGACNTGFADCNGNKLKDGCEKNTATDITNCGGCGIMCSTANIVAACANGVCNGNCNAGFADCDTNKGSDGCEVNLTTSPTNCGVCGAVCSKTNITNPTCSNSSCNGTCDAGYADCNGNKLVDGCEINITTNAANCGGCGATFACSSNHIATPTCLNSACNGSCASGFADCNGNKQTDGCEINTTSDPVNCGACGTTCSTQCTGNVTSTTCGSSACKVAGCTSGFVDFDTVCSNGCECTATTDGPACASATPLSAVALKLGGPAISRSSTMVLGTGTSATDIWYSVTFTGNADASMTFHPHIRLSADPLIKGLPEFVFDLRQDCGGTALAQSCAVESGFPVAKIDWEMFYSGLAPKPDPNTPSGSFAPVPLPGAAGVVYIRVYKNPAISPQPQTCDSFTVTVSE